jgi:hypothetical protein
VSESRCMITTVFCIVSLATLFGLAINTQYSDRGNRFEGLIGKPRGKTGIEILSFTRYLESYSSDRPVSLRVSFYCGEKGAVSVQAEDISEDIHYRMKANTINANPGWSTFYPWPTDILLAVGVTPDNLGVRAQREPVSDYHLCPSVIYSAKPDLTADYTLVFRPEYSQSDFHFEICDEKAPAKPLLTKTPSISPNAASEFEIRFPPDRLPEGALVLRLRGHNRNRAGGIFTDIYFNHVKEMPSDTDAQH